MSLVSDWGLIFYFYQFVVYLLWIVSLVIKIMSRIRIAWACYNCLIVLDFDGLGLHHHIHPMFILVFILLTLIKLLKILNIILCLNKLWFLIKLTLIELSSHLLIICHQFILHSHYNSLIGSLAFNLRLFIIFRNIFLFTSIIMKVVWRLHHFII